MVEVNCSGTKGFIHYSKGVFTSKGGKTLHAVAVVGYGNVRGVDMWIVRNSWSAEWGDKVSCLVTKYCCVRVFLCSIGCFLTALNSIPRATFL